MTQLWTLYHREIPEFLQRFANTPPMLRLRQVGMNCGCEYTQFPLFRDLAPYSRYDHSLGVALIVWHFTGDRKQTLAGLFHDVTTPVFAHVVDFLNGDHLRQESTEAGVAECLMASAEICALLQEYGILPEEISDYHRYPIADNDAPALSADRLEYTLGNLLNYGFADMEQLRVFYEDLEVGEDAAGKPELVFRTPAVASRFVQTALRAARVYVADEDRFAMETLAGVLRTALGRNALQLPDLMTTEPEVIEKLRRDAVCAAAWERFCGYSVILRSTEQPEEDGWLRVDAKKRWIDPLAQGKGRVSRWDSVAAEEILAFRSLDFSVWLRGE